MFECVKVLGCLGIKLLGKDKGNKNYSKKSINREGKMNKELENKIKIIIIKSKRQLVEEESYE